MVKNPPANAGDAGSIPGSGRSPEEGSGNPLQNLSLLQIFLFYLPGSDGTRCHDLSYFT